jgi:hypothetical protein
MRTEGDYETESRELAAENEPKKNLVLEKSKKDSLSAEQTQHKTNPTEITAAAASEQPWRGSRSIHRCSVAHRKISGAGKVNRGSTRAGRLGAGERTEESKCEPMRLHKNRWVIKPPATKKINFELDWISHTVPSSEQKIMQRSRDLSGGALAYRQKNGGKTKDRTMKNEDTNPKPETGGCRPKN